MAAETSPPGQLHPALTMVVTMLALIVAGCAYFVAASYWHFWPYTSQGGLACTTEAKMCPDGSAVGRTGPNCEFAACPATVTYTNTLFGLKVVLPISWTGSRNLGEEGEGAAWHGVTGSGMEIEGGPMVVLRHPAYTDAAPRQDIPIMVFTLAQWEEVNSPDSEWSVSAAPVPPTELARNSRYVFALPARYNYAFPEGFEEVERILGAGAVTAF